MSPVSGRLTLIVGGGVSGLAAARALQARGRQHLLLERCPTLGGLTRTVNVSEFCFDYTGHFLHLARVPSPADLPFASLNNAEWQKITRRSYCLVAGKLVPAPIQYNLGRLPEPLRKACVDSYETRPFLSPHGSASFRDFVVSGFGRELAELFLIPQNEKTLSTPLARLSPRGVRRFFPLPDEGLIRSGIRGEPVARDYNSTFWYPRKGGIELLLQGLSRGVEGIRLNEEVVALDLGRRRVTTASGQSFAYDHLLSSIPLPDLCRLSSDRELANRADRLTYGSTICVNLGVRGSVPKALDGVHWVYVADREIPFYRVGCYSNISEGNCAWGYHSLYVEIGVEGWTIRKSDGALPVQLSAVDALTRIGWLDPGAVVCATVNVIPCAYVHLTPEREDLLDGIRLRFQESGVRLIGRYGQWDYTSMEDCILSAAQAAEEVPS